MSAHTGLSDNYDVGATTLYQFVRAPPKSNSIFNAFSVFCLWLGYAYVCVCVGVGGWVSRTVD